MIHFQLDYKLKITYSSIQRNPIKTKTQNQQKIPSKTTVWSARAVSRNTIK